MEVEVPTTLALNFDTTPTPSQTTSQLKADANIEKKRTLSQLKADASIEKKRALSQLKAGASIEKKRAYWLKHYNKPYDELPSQEKAGVFSKVWFIWTDYYIKATYYGGAVKNENLPPVPESSYSHALQVRYEIYLREYKLKNGVRSPLYKGLLNVFAAEFLLTGFLAFLQMLCNLAVPILINKLLIYFAQTEKQSNAAVNRSFGTFVDPSDFFDTDPNPLTNRDGAIYTAALVFLSFIGSALFFSWNVMLSMKLGMDVRTICNSQVYRKSLRLSPSARLKYSTGELVTLMSSDSEKLPNSFVTMHNIWSSPLIVFLGMALLYNYIGNAAFVGLGILFVSIPIQGVLAVKSFEAQKKMATFTDLRNNMINEALQGIKILKLYCWEDNYEARIKAYRSSEMDSCEKYVYLNAYMIATFIGLPIFLNLGVFLVHYALGGDMGPSTVFTAISLLSIIRLPMTMLPMTISSAISATIGIRRMDLFFNASEMQEGDMDECIDNENAIEVNGVFTYGGVEVKVDEAVKSSSHKGAVVMDDSSAAAPRAESAAVVEVQAFQLTLNGIEVKKGELIAVVGAVGSGKSSFISAILKEMEANGSSSTYIRQTGTVGLASQTPWIFNATVKENILMGREYNKEKFDRALKICALEEDVKMLPAGVLTEIGEKGINLSGGQKARVSLARVVYREVDLVLLDDCLSAVDAHVGKHLFDLAIKEELHEKGKTIIFATNQLHVLKRCDRVICMKDGNVAEIGSYEQLYREGGAFFNLMKDFSTVAIRKSSSVDIASSKVHVLTKDDVLDLSDIETTTITTLARATSMPEDVKVSKAGETLITKEGQAEGAVGSEVLHAYFVTALGGSMLAFTYLLPISTITQVLQNFHERLVSLWSIEYIYYENDLVNDYHLYLILWIVFGVITLVLALFRARAWAFQSVSASRTMHDALLTNVLACQMSFFDTTPLGRILNRFTKDFYMTDIELPRVIINFVVCFTTVAGTFITIAYVLPYFITVFFPICYAYWKIQALYRPISRDLQRIESASRSPIFASFSEAVGGVISVRAFKISDELVAKSDKLIDSGNSAFIMMHYSNRWLQVRLELLAAFTMAFVSIFILLAKEYPDAITINAGDAGLLITYVQVVTSLLTWVIRMGCECEAKITSVERIFEYANLTTVEKPPINFDYRPAAQWPSEGQITLTDLSLRYREGLPKVLDGVNLVIPGGSRVGVAGRTGSGKSTLLIALFRISEPDDGSSIVIDGFDCMKGGLRDVRSAISIIPQDPVMFVGSVRSNVDPTEAYTDDEVWVALRLACLGDAIETLNDEVSEGGANFSTGQRQLFCLARALLRRTKILVLDEATANIDQATDVKLQRVIRQEFANCTVITIAHRLNTILDSDYILIMDKGKVGEFDSPANLKADKNSMLSSLLKSESGH